MILSKRRLDHLTILSNEDVEITSFDFNDNELVKVHSDVVPTEYSYQPLYVERFEHIDHDLIKAVVHYYSKIHPDEVVPLGHYGNKYAILKNNQTLFLPFTVIKKIQAFDFSLYEGYKLLSDNFLSVLAWEKYNQENVNTTPPKIVLGKLVLVKEHFTEIRRIERSLAEQGWEYINYIRDYDGLYQEFLKEWQLVSKIVVIGLKKYFFVKAHERFFHGTLEQWISESLTLLIRGNIPTVYVFEYPYRGHEPSQHIITLKYLSILAYSKLVDQNVLLAQFYQNIRVHRDLSVEMKLFSFQELKEFKKALRGLRRTQIYFIPVDSFYDGVIYRYLYRDALLINHENQEWLVNTQDLTNICKTKSKLSKKFRQELFNFYSFCQPKLPSNISLKDLLMIVPKFLSYEPLTAFCDINHNNDLPALSKFLFYTLEFAWRGYYAYSILPGTLPYIPYTEPEDLTGCFNFLGKSNFLQANIQGIEVVIDDDGKKSLNMWEQGEMLNVWEKYYYRKNDQFSKTLLHRLSFTQLTQVSGV